MRHNRSNSSGIAGRDFIVQRSTSQERLLVQPCNLPHRSALGDMTAVCVCPVLCSGDAAMDDVRGIACLTYPGASCSDMYPAPGAETA